MTRKNIAMTNLIERYAVNKYLRISELTMIGGEAVDDGHVVPEGALVLLHHERRLDLAHSAQPAQLGRRQEQVMWRHLARHRETLQ